MKEKFQVGDKIRIRQWNDMSKEFKKDGAGNIILSNSWFTKNMTHLCGRTAIIKSFHNGDYDHGVELEKWSNNEGDMNWKFTVDMFELADSENDGITINQYGNKVVAKFGRKVGVARCCPDDEFDLYTGSKLALDRLFDKEDKDAKEVHRTAKVGEWIKIVNADVVDGYYKNGDILKVKTLDKDSIWGKDVVFVEEYDIRIYTDEYVVLENYLPKNKEKLLNGKFVCVQTCDTGLTVGKVYEFIKGTSSFDSGIKLPNPNGTERRNKPIKDINDLHEYMSISETKFIPLVED